MPKEYKDMTNEEKEKLAYEMDQLKLFLEGSMHQMEKLEKLTSYHSLEGDKFRLLFFNTKHVRDEVISLGEYLNNIEGEENEM